MADSVTSMARKPEGPWMLVESDGWSMLGRKDTKEEKDKKGHAKIEHKGKLSHGLWFSQEQRPQLVL